MFMIPDADALVTYLKDFTGSNDDAEIKQCIFLAELAMRNIELPALRTNPYETFGVVGPNQLMPIPADMNKPILFFQQGQYGTPEVTTTATATGTAATNIITLTSVPGEGLAIGMLVTGTGIAGNTTIVSFNSSTELVLSNNNTGNVSGTLTFTSTTLSTNSVSTGPWIVYDRIGDRDIITQGLIAQLYLTPVNVPAVIRGKFSEVGDNYQFLPYVAEGAMLNLYYYRAWDLLFTPIQYDTLISATGTISSISGIGPTWTVVITGMSTTAGLSTTNQIVATDGTGSLGYENTATVVTVDSGTQITVTVAGQIAPTAGTITDISLISDTPATIQTNEVLQSWPEGYIYNSLHEYYVKRHSPEDAAMYKQKAIDAWKTVEDQNNLGKWSGGHTRLTSIFQPRRDRQYAVK
jgi:hypothetical protein